MTTEPDSPLPIRRLDHVPEQDLAGLADVVVDVVEGGASIGFMHPYTHAQGMQFWRGIAEDVERGARVLLVAEDEVGIVGTVHLVLEQPDNQPHRADLSKMLVHRRGRRRGVGAALLRAAEETARASGRSLLVLDTASDVAERLYVRQGWIRVGVVPGFALEPTGAPCDTTFFYRELSLDPGRG